MGILGPVTPKTKINLITDDESRENMAIVTETKKGTYLLQNLGEK